MTDYSVFVAQADYEFGYPSEKTFLMELQRPSFDRDAFKKLKSGSMIIARYGGHVLGFTVIQNAVPLKPKMFTVYDELSNIPSPPAFSQYGSGLEIRQYKRNFFQAYKNLNNYRLIVFAARCGIEFKIILNIVMDLCVIMTRQIEDEETRVPCEALLAAVASGDMKAVVATEQALKSQLNYLAREGSGSRFGSAVVQIGHFYRRHGNRAFRKIVDEFFDYDQQNKSRALDEPYNNLQQVRQIIEHHIPPIDLYLEIFKKSSQASR